MLAVKPKSILIIRPHISNKYFIPIYINMFTTKYNERTLNDFENVIHYLEC